MSFGVPKRVLSGLRLAEQGATAALAAWAFTWMLADGGEASRRAAPTAAAHGKSSRRDLSAEAFERAEPGRGRGARSPVQIPGRGWVDIFWRVFQAFNGDRLMFVAGGVTFFTLLAVFPATGAFVSLYGLFFDPAKAHQEVSLLYGLAPDGVVDFLGDQIDLLARRRTSTLSVAFAVTVLLSIWSANASVKALIYGLNVAYHETEKRNFLRYTILTLTFTLASLGFVLFTSALVVALPIVEDWLGLSWNRMGLGWVRWPVLFLGYVAMLSVLYRYGPCRQHPRWRWLTPGGVFAAALNLAVSWLFSWYLGNVAHYDVTYGPLGAIMGFMIWTWWSITVILVGAELNAEVEHQTVLDTTTGPPEPMGLRGALVADTVGPRRGAPGFVQYTLDGALELSRRLMMRKGRNPEP